MMEFVNFLRPLFERGRKGPSIFTNSGVFVIAVNDILGNLNVILNDILK
jgi:hypothetical protein